jgi:hypothetical protein
MATVYLPYGWPRLSGEFESVIYQGTLARAYVGVDDPRTGSQVMARRIFADAQRVKAAAGAWAKFLWKRRLGNRWSTILYQVPLGDVGGLWTAAMDAWNAKSDAQRQAWRDYAPYVVTYNDPGKVFWGMAYVVYEWLQANLNGFYDQPNPADEDPEAMGIWWLQDVAPNTPGEDMAWVDRGRYSFVDDRDLRCVYSGNWTQWNGNGPYLLTMSQSHNAGDTVTVEIVGDWLDVYYAKNVDCGSFRIYIDDVLKATINAKASLAWQQLWRSSYLGKGTHVVKLENIGGGLLDFDALKVYNDVQEDWFTYAGGGNSFVVDNNCDLNRYALCASGYETEARLIVKGRWASLTYVAGPGRGDVDFYCDGKLKLTFSQLSASTLYFRNLVLPALGGAGLHELIFKKHASGTMCIDGFQVADIKANVGGSVGSL